MKQISKFGPVVLSFVLVGLLLWPSDAGARRVRGILGQSAPALEVSSWFNLSKGKKKAELTDHKGDVIMLFFFQSWCPGCHSRGFPTLQAVVKHFQGAPDVGFMAVQTVFEGFGTNTAKRAKTEADKIGLKIPVGHDAGPRNTGSRVMRRYRSGGTPWIVIIDKTGIVRFNAFHIPPAQAISLIERLRKM